MGISTPNGNPPSSLPSFQGSNANDSLGLQLPRALHGGAYEQAALNQLNNRPTSLPNSSLLNPLQAPLPQPSYSDLPHAYGARGLPLSQTYGAALDNLNYAQSLLDPYAALNSRNNLSSQLGASPYDGIAALRARYNSDLALLNQDASLIDGMMGLRSLQTGRNPRLSHLSELAAAEETLNSQLLLQFQLQQQQQKANVLMDH